MNFFQRFFGHLRTVHKHRAMVRKLCFKCGLYWQGLTHDLSKYSPVEFWNGVKFYTGTKSPHVGEREKYGYSKAWIHHHNKNKHHAEYWQDIGRDGKATAITMPSRYLVEMLCDRLAASKIYLKDKYTNEAPFDYYYSHKDENQFNQATRVMLQYSLATLANDGEEEFFALMHRILKEDKNIRKGKVKENDET